MYHRRAMNDGGQQMRSDSQQASETRRRLLRGSMALPAVLTVCPGMASAQSVVNCIQTPTGQKEALTAVETDIIPWVRVQIIANIKKTDDGYRYFQYDVATGSQPAYPPIDATAWNRDIWYRITASSGDVARTGIPTQSQFNTSGAQVQANQVTYKVVQLFSPTGQRLGIPQLVGGPETGWASIACLASFTP